MSSASGPQWPDQPGWPGPGGQPGQAGPGEPPPGPNDTAPGSDDTAPGSDDTAPGSDPPPAGFFGPPGAPVSPQFRQVYGQPATWPPVVSPRATNSLAIAALCCGIGQLAVGPLSGIPAIVLGAMSLRQIRETGEDGHGMAVAGVVLGVTGLVLFITIIAIVVAIFSDVVSHSSAP
jgi:hypothetical protein